jgi:DNA-binding MarR family transcriptional regulator
MVDDLADRELVDRAPDPADRRRNIITITPVGIRQLQRLDELLTQIQDEVLAPLSTAERAQLAQLLTQVVDHHQGRNGD